MPVVNRPGIFRTTAEYPAPEPVAPAAVESSQHVMRHNELGARIMKAIVYEKYGSFDDLEMRDIAKPVIKDDEVLVHIRAAGLHIGDCFAVRGSPFVVRVATGLLKPKHGIPGFDGAGEVEAVGATVRNLRPGDAVFGQCDRACAEYAAVNQDKLALKPANLTFEQAAALPTSALAALHALRDVGKLRLGQKVLINGASGGVGTFAVQIAKSLAADVTGVCSTENAEMVRSLGADHVIDYTREDFTRGGRRYDVIFDNVEKRSLSDCRRALSPEGTLILNSGTGAKGIGMLVRLVKPLVMSLFVGQNLRRYLSVANHEDLVVLKELVESGRLKPVVDRTHPLHETAKALRYIEAGHARGKVVVTI
jgi:NADPH:quinone reductase-like Zn-dependent oxidoreductase